ncbi:hypothetical protein C0J52_15052 [Blattella germanica]|nr:hypothetical protein C0J52_15052 [Blattella germanica]
MQFKLNHVTECVVTMRLNRKNVPKEVMETKFKKRGNQNLTPRHASDNTLPRMRDWHFSVRSLPRVVNLLHKGGVLYAQSMEREKQLSTAAKSVMWDFCVETTLKDITLHSIFK